MKYLLATILVLALSTASFAQTPHYIPTLPRHMPTMPQVPTPHASNGYLGQRPVKVHGSYFYFNNRTYMYRHNYHRHRFNSYYPHSYYYTRPGHYNGGVGIYFRF